MKPFTTTRRRVARDFARAGAAVSAAMLALTLAAAMGAGDHHVSALGTNAGSLSLAVAPPAPNVGQTLTSGSASTPFAVVPPAGASCTGDSTSGGYRVQSYIVPASVDPATLSWDASGPVPSGTGANLRLPLFSSIGSPFVNKATGVASTPGGPGLVAAALVDPFSFVAIQAAGGPAIVPDGQYNVGLACTSAAGAVQDKFWNVKLTFAAQAGELNWTVTSTPPPTTTPVTTAPGTTVPATTTPGTTAPGTTVSGASTTPQTTTNLGVLPASLGSNAGGDGGLLVSTGSSPMPLVLWAVFLLVFGRMAILFGRPIEVLPAGP